MDTILKKLEEFNNVVNQVFDNEDYEYYKLAEPITAEQKDLDELEALVEMPLPNSLKSLYKKLGHITTKENSENHSISINEPKALIEDTKEIFAESYSDRELSFGLIDTIISQWGFDRPEFQEYKYLSETETKEINNQYKCFGLWRNEDGFEEGYYLFFDKNGHFGELHYHQDNISDAITYLKDLLKTGLNEKQNLEEILIRAIDTTKETMIEWNE